MALSQLLYLCIPQQQRYTLRMSLEEKLKGWTGPSSTTEQEKQERVERMIRQAVKESQAV